jgi:hypothetical protein
MSLRKCRQQKNGQTYASWQLVESYRTAREPRQVFEEIAQIRTVDVVSPTKGGPELRRRCVAEPTKHQAILLHRLGLTLPRRLEMHAV